MDGKTDWKAIWWTSAIVTVTTIVISGILQLIEKNIINKGAYAKMQGYFLGVQPDYFPLIFLLVVFIVTVAVVWLYSILLPQLPQNWIYRGILIGGFLFLIGDLPNAMVTAYTTVTPPGLVRDLTFAALINKLINGCILTNIYRRFSFEEQIEQQSGAPVKGPRV